VDRLPIELWKSILEFATHRPSEIGPAEWTGDYDTLKFGRLSLPDLVTPTYELYPDLQTRVKLSKVSRLWRDMMPPILYQTIVVNDLDHIKNFAQLMSRDSSIGSLVRRLDVRHLPLNDKRLKKAGDPGLQTLFDACPNLVFLNISSDQDGNVSEWILDRNNYPKTPNLQLLHVWLMHMESQPTRVSWLNPFQNIRVLFLSKGICFAPELKENMPLSLPNLEIMDMSNLDFGVECLDDCLAESFLPRLHTVCIYLGWWEPHKIPRFWNKIASQIKTFRIGDFTRHKDARFRDFSAVLPFITNFSNAEQLIVQPCMKKTLLIQLAKNSNIRILEMNLDYGKYDLKTFQADVGKVFPKLEHFRISNIPAKINDEKELMLIKRLVGYLTTYEQSIRSRGISILATYVGGREVKSRQELEKMCHEEEAKLEKQLENELLLRILSNRIKSQNM
jgi:hypothetical protein